MQAQEFVRKWQAGGAANELNERAGAQAHFIDLCRVLGVPEPGDPKQYCFERGVAKTGCKKDLAKRTLTNLYNQRATWLASIARNSAIDSLRRRKAQPQTISTTVHDADDGDDRDLLHDFASNDPGPAQQVEQAAQARAPLSMDEVSLFNPTQGYGAYVVPAVAWLIAQQTLLIAAAMLAGRWRERGQLGTSARGWWGRIAAMALWGLASGAFYLGWVTVLQGYPRGANLGGALVLLGVLVVTLRGALRARR